MIVLSIVERVGEATVLGTHQRMVFIRKMLNHPHTSFLSAGITSERTNKDVLHISQFCLRQQSSQIYFFKLKFVELDENET